MFLYVPSLKHQLYQKYKFPSLCLGLQNWRLCRWKSGFLLFISKMKPRDRHEGLPQDFNDGLLENWDGGPRTQALSPAYLLIKYSYLYGKYSRWEKVALTDQELFSLKYICSLKMNKVPAFFRSLSLWIAVLSPQPYTPCRCFQSNSP